MSQNTNSMDFMKVIEIINKKWDKGEVEFSSETTTTIVVNDCGITSSFTLANDQDCLLHSEHGISGLTQTQETEFTWFMEKESELIKEYKNKWVIIKDNTVIYSSEYLEIANDFALKELCLTPGSYLIQYCTQYPTEFKNKIYIPKTQKT